MNSIQDVGSFRFITSIEIEYFETATSNGLWSARYWEWWRFDVVPPDEQHNRERRLLNQRRLFLDPGNMSIWYGYFWNSNNRTDLMCDEVMMLRSSSKGFTVSSIDESKENESNPNETPIKITLNEEVSCNVVFTIRFSFILFIIWFSLWVQILLLLTIMLMNYLVCGYACPNLILVV